MPRLLPRARERGFSEFVWGMVQFENPLSVLLDGETSPIGVAIDSLVDRASLKIGDRVRCEFDGRRLVVHGVAGGSQPRNPYARYVLRRDIAPLTIPSGTNTKVRFSEALDSHPDVVQQNGYRDYVLKRTGVWTVQFSLRWGSSGYNKYATVATSDNINPGRRYVAGTSGSSNDINASLTRKFYNGDSVSIVAYQSSGSDKEIVDLFWEATSLSIYYNGPG